MMSLGNRVASLRGRHEKAKERAIRWENVVDEVRGGCIGFAEELTHVKETTWQLYRTMRERKGAEPELKREEVEEQLRYVKSTLKDLEKVVRRALGKREERAGEEGDRKVRVLWSRSSDEERMR